MREWLRRRLPTLESLRERRGLRWLAPLMRRPWLWQLSRRRVALGAGIGVFFGLVVPVAQIACAAGAAVLLRANLPVAVVATLVSNPFTYAPIGVLAYRTGAAVLGEPVRPGALKALAGIGGPPDGGSHPGFAERLKSIGRPLVVGLALLAVGSALAAWALVHVVWTLSVWLRRQQRRRRGEADEAQEDAGPGTGGAAS